ncbi:Pro-kumamolisin, activation domain-containing protein [Mycena pura]|uniref:Pro-kumamolisin, activation domain-containing protein n=1 Tax=Mycena pura TaxID=153505 RepID=A0AAD6V529_9AGAR|nr:Pro-kumamolisin, activation domain-containing protein [Mycena pura]
MYYNQILVDAAALKNLSGVALPVPKWENLRNRVKFVLLQQGENHRYPQSPNYGKHWTHAQVKETFRPDTETVETVQAWLTHYAGIAGDKLKLSANGDMFELNVTIAEAEALLHAEYLRAKRAILPFT